MGRCSVVALGGPSLVEVSLEKVAAVCHSYLGHGHLPVKRIWMVPQHWQHPLYLSSLKGGEHIQIFKKKKPKTLKN